MREIKFRAWDGANNKMVFAVDEPVEQGDDLLNYLFVQFEDFTFGFLPEGEGNRLPTMQYTGKKDKDGCELFENDIVADEDGNTALILWSKRQAQFYVDYDEYQDLDGIGSWATKIGNIYENPELVDK